MCSRYEFVPEQRAWADFRARFGALADELLALPARPRLAPTDTVPILARHGGEAPQVVQARWGFVPHWWRRPELPRLCFNARSEEAAGKPMWRDALRSGRCLIPATSWIEWRHAHGAKIPHRLQPQDGHGFMFAGLWSVWHPRPGAAPLATCAMLTTAAAPAVREVHERMPVVLAPAAWEAWLDPALSDAAAVLALLRQHTVDAVLAVTVD